MSLLSLSLATPFLCGSSRSLSLQPFGTLLWREITKRRHPVEITRKISEVVNVRDIAGGKLFNGTGDEGSELGAELIASCGI